MEKTMLQTEKKIWELYEELKEIVTVVDMENYELVYLNRRACELYGIKAVEETKGKKCYEVLMGSATPCAVCNGNRLAPGTFVEEVRYNPVIRKKLALKDTVIEEHGKRYRFELAVDLSAWEQQNRRYEDNETMVNEGLRISLAAPTPEESIHVLLEYLGQSLNSDRAFLFEEREKGTLDNTYEWCAKGVDPKKGNLQKIPVQVVGSWYEKFLKSENIVVRDVGAMKESDPALYGYLGPMNVQSVVASPLIYNGEIIGFYGVDNPPEKLLLHIMTLLQILGHFIVSLLHRRNHVCRLEELCFQDQLTGIGNRHAMNEYLTIIQPQKSIGVLYCDVMGLKLVNDTKGHREGDRLLIRASECLRKAFKEYALFRIGGDEFLALCQGITQKELEEKAELLREIMQEKKSLMALGFAWNPDGKCNMEQLLKEADGRMYENKRAWYAIHPKTT